jgi:hypothetical protein
VPGERAADGAGALAERLELLETASVGVTAFLRNDSLLRI